MAKLERIKNFKVKEKELLNDQEQKRLHILLKKEKHVLRKYLTLTNFKQPVLFLIRNERVEFYEDIRGDRFQVPDDDKGRVIRLGTNLLDFEYGKNTFKGYICNIEEAFPLPQKPMVYSELMELIIRKIITNYKNLESSGDNLRKTLWTLFFMVLLGAIAYYWLIAPKISPGAINAIAANATNITTTVVQTVKANATIVI